MSKESLIEFSGVVSELLPNATFRVKLDNNHVILAHASGNMRKHRIRVLAGDRVTVKMTPYEATKAVLHFAKNKWFYNQILLSKHNHLLRLAVLYQNILQTAFAILSNPVRS